MHRRPSESLKHLLGCTVTSYHFNNSWTVYFFVFPLESVEILLMCELESHAKYQGLARQNIVYEIVWIDIKTAYEH